MSEKNKSRREFMKDLNRRQLLKAVAFTTAGAAIMGVRKKAEAVEEAVNVAKKVPRYAMLIDLRRCIGCQACSVACKTEFDVRLGVFKSQVITYESGKYPKTKKRFLPWLCNHCENPPCVGVCPVEKIKATFELPDGRTVEYEKAATYKRPDGAVLYDIDRCIGCHLCVKACPYNARYVEPLKKAGASPKRNAIGKCTFCVHRTDKGVVPSCVNTCMGRARIFGDINDPKAEIAMLLKKEKTNVIHPEFGTEPRVFYIDYDQEVYDKGVDIRDQVK